jgi:hypothetical protein
MAAIKSNTKNMKSLLGEFLLFSPSKRKNKGEGRTG